MPEILRLSFAIFLIIWIFAIFFLNFFGPISKTIHNIVRIVLDLGYIFSKEDFTRVFFPTAVKNSFKKINCKICMIVSILEVDGKIRI